MAGNLRTYEELLQSNERLTNILRHLLPDRLSGVYFICGEAGSHDRNGLPDRILVCPAYGSDDMEVYEKMK